MSNSVRSVGSIRVGVSAVIIRTDALLLVEFNDSASGRHYNLPGGGVEPGESLYQALQREVMEEASIHVEVQRLLLVWEYVPALYNYRYGDRQKLTLCFRCQLAPNAEPSMPAVPDPNQTGVCWLSLADLSRVRLLPHIADRLLAAIATPNTPDILFDGML